MDLYAYLLGRISRLPPGEHPLRRIDAFRRQFPRPHLVFACHAALPIGLTPHLLNMLWVNFQRDQCNTPLKIPWVATADLLLSKLCQRVGGSLFEMPSGVRQELLAALYQDDCFGERRLFDLAVFVREYVRPELEGSDPYWRPVAQAQDWNALAYMDPEQAARSLARELGQSIQKNDYAEQLRLASILETLADPLRGYAGLVEYGRLRRHLIQGQAPTAQEATLASQQVQTVAATTTGGMLSIPGLEDLPLPPLEQDLPVESANAQQETLLIQARLALSQRNFALAKQLALSAKELGPSSLQIDYLQDAAEGLPSRLEYMVKAQKAGDFSAYQLHLEEAQYLLAHLEPDPQSAQALLEHLLGGPPATREAFEQAATAPAPTPPPAEHVIDLAAVRGITNEQARAEALIKLVPQLPDELLGEVRSIAQDISDEASRASIQIALIPRVPEGEKGIFVRETLETFQSIQDERIRAQALVALSPFITENSVDQLLSAVLGIKDGTILVPAISALIPALPPFQRQVAKETALDALQEISDPRSRTEALIALLNSQTGIEKERLEEETLQTVVNFDDPQTRLEAWIVLLPHLSEKTRQVVLEEALRMVQSIKSERTRVETWITLLPYLAPEQRQGVVNQALKAAFEIYNERARVETLLELLPLLTEAQRKDVLDWMLQTVLKIENEQTRVEVLLDLMPYLPDQQREAVGKDALAAAEKIPESKARSRLLDELARYLPVKAAEEQPPGVETTQAAEVPSSDLLAVPVAISGDDQTAVSLLVEAIESGMNETPAFIKLALPEETPLIEVRCETANDFYRITLVNTEYPGRVVTTAKRTTEDASHAFMILRRIAYWLIFLNRHNPQTKLPVGAVSMELSTHDPQTGEQISSIAATMVDFPIQISYNPARNPAGVPIQLRLRHTLKVDQPLYCALYALNEDFSISTRSFFDSGIWLQPGKEAWAIAYNPERRLHLNIKPEVLAQGVKTTRTALKLVVGTDEFDARLLEQPGIGILGEPKEPIPSAKQAGHVTLSSFGYASSPLQNLLPAEPSDQEDWSTQIAWIEISVTEEPIGEGQSAEVTQQVPVERPEDGTLYFNGINGEIGDYDLPPMAISELSNLIQEAQPPDNLDELRRRQYRDTQNVL